MPLLYPPNSTPGLLLGGILCWKHQPSNLTLEQCSLRGEVLKARRCRLKNKPSWERLKVPESKGDAEVIKMRQKQEETRRWSGLVPSVAYYLSRWYYNVCHAEYERWHFYVRGSKTWWGQTCGNKQSPSVRLSFSLTLSPMTSWLGCSLPSSLMCSPRTLLLSFSFDLVQKLVA